MVNRKIEFWIITSKEDQASMNIRKHLLEKYHFLLCENHKENWQYWEGNQTYLLDSVSIKEFQEISKFNNFFNIRLVLTDNRMIFLDDGLSDTQLEKKFGDFIIFASRHRSKSAIPAILTHTPGNWNFDNSQGGKANSLSITSAFMLGFAYKNLLKQKQLKNLDWPVDLEVDHHGPTEIKSPIIFMELGSSSLNWKDEKGASAVGDAIIGTIYDYFNLIFNKLRINYVLEQDQSITKYHIYKYINNELKSKNFTIGIGFGGPHYARNFSKIYHNNDSVFISHIVPKYFVSQLNIYHINQMIKNTIEPINTAILDWKGINSAEKNHIMDLLGNIDIKIEKTKKLH